jgi:hypothetical protein
MISALHSFPKNSSPFLETGLAFNIRCPPDLFTGELINVGICIISTDGSRIGKVISEPGRLSCLFGDSSAAGIVQLANIALCEALQGNPSPSPNIVFEEPTPIYNSTPLEALDDIFSSQVTAAIPLRTESSQRPPTHPTTKVIARLYNCLRETNSDAANEIIPQSLQTVVNTRKGQRAVQIALQPTGGAGIVESAAYGAGTVRSHLLDALLDLEWAAEAKGLERLGFFIVRPSDWPDAKQNEVDRAIDNVTDRIPTRIRVEVESDYGTMAQHIIKWAAIQTA